MIHKKSSQHWLQNHKNDFFVQSAKKDGYRARAAYKLQEIDVQENLIKPGQVVIDLGSAPGSWTQYVQHKLFNLNQHDNIRSVIISIDKLRMHPVKNVSFIQGDFLKSDFLFELEKVLNGRKADLILSDIAPNLSGIAIVDTMRMSQINLSVIQFAKIYMNSAGSLLTKCFHGIHYSQLLRVFNTVFKIVRPKKPKASRVQSSEVFLLCKVLKTL